MAPGGAISEVISAGFGVKVEAVEAAIILGSCASTDGIEEESRPTATTIAITTEKRVRAIPTRRKFFLQKSYSGAMLLCSDNTCQLRVVSAKPDSVCLSLVTEMLLPCAKIFQLHDHSPPCK